MALKASERPGIVWKRRNKGTNCRWSLHGYEEQNCW